MRGKHVSIAVVAVASLAALLGLFWETPASGVLFAAAALTFPPALVGLAVSRRGRIGSLRGPLLVFAGLLQASLVAMLLLGDRPDPETWWLGLPPATLVLLVGVWLLPLAFVSVLHARWFCREGLTEEDLRRIRDLAKRTGDAGEER